MAKNEIWTKDFILITLVNFYDRNQFLFVTGCNI
jgi:hypothetical protein